MPTTNQHQQQQQQQPQQIDTNNNSNNKITNGHSSGVLAPLASVVALVGSNSNSSATMNLPVVVGQTIRAQATQPSNDLISAIKHHEIHPMNNNNSSSSSNNNNNINNNNISSSNGLISSNHNGTNSISSINSNSNNIDNNSRLASATTLNSNTSKQTTMAGKQQFANNLRSLDELNGLISDLNFDRTSLSNEELIRLVKSNLVSIYKLESFLGKDNAARCVEIRRNYYRTVLAELDKLDQLGIRDRAEAFNHPRYEDLDYERVNGACCENVVGHVKVPVGLAGPLVLDGEEIFVPLATTEGCLVASTCRGLSALRKSGGVSSRVRRDFMTRAPIVRFQDATLSDALDNVERAIIWLNDLKNKELMRAAFNLTSSHGKFLNYTMYPVNREIHIRFEAQTGDAMGMNMCSKGVESALKEMQRAFPTMEIVTLSGNMCTDKKAAGINWINGRGKSVECNAELPAQVVQQVFKVTVDQLVDRWKSKVMIGSALAASIGGFNSQAANILTAIFIATGQDPAQNVTSSNCMLILEKDSKGSLVVCCTMPSIECGTVGGGTILGDQSRYLQLMGVRGPTPKLIRQPENTTQTTLAALGQSAGRQLHQQKPQKPIRQHSYHQNQKQLMFSEARRSSLSHLHEHEQPIEDQQNGCSSLFDTSSPASFSNNCGAVSEISSSSSSSSSSSLTTSHPIEQSSNHFPSVVTNTNEYTNARKLARIVCATVMAAELSLLAALTEGTLVKSHMRHNRSSTNVTTTSGLAAPALAGHHRQVCFGPLGSGSGNSTINHNHYLISNMNNLTNCIGAPNNCHNSNQGGLGLTYEESFTPMELNKSLHSRSSINNNSSIEIASYSYNIDSLTSINHSLISSSGCNPKTTTTTTTMFVSPITSEHSAHACGLGGDTYSGATTFATGTAANTTTTTTTTANCSRGSS